MAKENSKNYKEKDKNRYRIYKPKEILPKEVENPISVSVSEAAKIGGVTTKTIRRAIQDDLISYKVINNRYQIDLRSTILFLNSSRKLKNKLDQLGFGQYIGKWKN